MAHTGPRHRPQRRPREWVIRGGGAAIALVLGYASITQSLALSLAKTNAEQAHALAPSDGRVAGELAERLATRNTDAAPRARAKRLAKEALANEPLAASALVALALTTQLEGDTTEARRLFRHSDALTRRELGTRLWLIEDAVGRNDVPGVLRQYDIALRTSKAAPDLLFPVLSEAITDPAIVSALAKTLAAPAPWGDAFINDVAQSTKHPVAVASLFQQLSKRAVTVSPFAQSALVNTLVAKGSFAAGWDYYRSLRPQARRTISRDADFSAQLEAPSVFDWVPVMNDAGVTTSLQRTAEGGLFDFFVPATVGGVVLQQVQVLAPGRYRLDGVSSGIDQDRAARPYWQLACLSGRELGRIPLPNSSEKSGRFSGTFAFNGECPAQVLRLVTQPSSAIGGTTGQITHAQLRLIGAAQ